MRMRMCNALPLSPHKTAPDVVSSPLFFPPRRRHRISGEKGIGVAIMGVSTRGRLMDCDIAGNKLAGVQITAGADPSVVACK